MTIAIKRESKMASPFQTKLATNLIASRQFVFFASVKHCFFKVSACSPGRKSWKDVEKNFVINSVESCRKVKDKDNYTKFPVNFNKNIINKLEKESFTAVITFVTEL